MSFIILIPAYKPEERLVHLVEQLSAASPAPIVIVNDGSPAEHDPIFTSLTHIPRVQVLAHPANQGKGAALRTGFRHLETLPSEFTCVVTADADGQHSVKDILAVGAAAAQNPEAMIIGSRRFDKDVPPKSMFGNTVTRWVMRLFFGVNLWDTQTGLRGIPRSLLPDLIDIPYNRYELEIEMLMVAYHRSVPFVEIPIETIYIESNRSSHYKPVRDSARVYYVLFRHALAVLTAAGADYLMFALVHAITHQIPLSMLLARITFILIYYILLKRWALLSQKKIQRAFPRNVLLVAFCAVITTLLIPLLVDRFSFKPVNAKLLIEVGLFLVGALIHKVTAFLRSIVRS